MIFKELDGLLAINHEIQLINDEQKTKLIDLDFDCMHSIMIHLNLDNLLKFGQTSRDFHSMVAYVLKNQLSSKEFVFEMCTDAKPKFNVTEKRIEIYNYELAMHIGKNYGNLIRHFFQSASPYYRTKYGVYFQYINVYCHKSLVNFDFNDFFPYGVMTNPLRNVENITFSAYFR